MAKAKASFHWDDPLLLDQQLTRRRARGARRRARLLRRTGSLPRVLEAFRNGTTDVAIFREMGELGLLGATIPEQYGGGGAELRLLRPGRARDRARRLGLPLDDERAVVAGDGADQRVRHRGAEAEVPAEARARRVDRLLRPDRAEPRLRPRQHGHARAARSPAATRSAAARCGSPTRRSPTCSSSGPRTTKARSAASSSRRAPRA